MRRTLHFKPSARLQSILSRELVADPNVAVLEFVKNGYDAGASQVVIDFDLGDTAAAGKLTIADDGEGMDLEEFERNWMRPGYSEKAADDYRPRRGRAPAGEKGLGRLAAGRLGDRLEVWTRKDSSSPWLHATFVWKDFEDMDRPLSAVGIKVDDEGEPEEPVGDQGTVVQISGLRLNWNAKVPGRKAANRHPTRLGRLRQDLEQLLMPLTAAQEPFAIWIEHNSTQEEDDEPGPIEAPTLELIHYQYDFEVHPRGKGWEVKRVVRRGKNLLEDPVSKQLGLKAKETGHRKLASPVSEVELAEVGSFSGSLFYAPGSVEHLRRIRAPIGVLLYRDGIRVEPYGQPGNDWLGAQARKASRQGYAAIQPNALYGAVRISRSENPELRSQANREGLLENDVYEAFIQICREEFEQFEKTVYGEYLEPHWRSKGQQRLEKTEASQGYALSLTRALIHRVSQPVATANATLDRMQTLIDSERVADDSIREELQELHDKTSLQLSQIGDAITRVLEMLDFDPTPTRFEVGDLIDEVVGGSGLPSSQVTATYDENLRMNLPRPPVVEALSELLANAAAAPRPDGVVPEVRISTEANKRNVKIVVADNGSGIDPTVSPDLFKRATSTKGEIGMGLIIIRRLLNVIEGELDLRKSTKKGTEFVISLPKDQA